MLVILALFLFRKDGKIQKNIEIHAIHHHDHLLQFAKLLGADKCIDTR